MCLDPDYKGPPPEPFKFKLTREAVEEAYIWAAMENSELLEIRVSPQQLADYNREMLALGRAVLAGDAQWLVPPSVRLTADDTLKDEEVVFIVKANKLPVMHSCYP